jgi:phosphoribosylamine--glycine ligase/phosphoribosylformylglycinamidine cyclo-ligase
MASITVLLIGSGGREHALAWKLSQSPEVERILVVPGNGGTAAVPKVQNIADVSAADFPALVKLAQAEGVDLVVPGPEQPLVDGIESYFRNTRARVFGPSKEAARMEGSKTFSKDFMKRHGIPTAAYENFSDHDKAQAYVDEVRHDVVIKATGLAAGKGVIIPTSKEEAKQALRQIMVEKQFGEAGDEVVIEEFLTGDELSILSFSDGTTIRSLPPAQDHKRIFDGDQGPNTGGMGCYAPTRIATPALIDQIEREILQPTINGMRKDGFPFVGMLFTGLMITRTGPKVLEYNVRFGDPETQTVLPLLESDLAAIMMACTSGFLRLLPVTVKPAYSTTVVVAAGGYPGSYAKGTPMDVQEPTGSDDLFIFHAGTALAANGQLATAGGRVIAATATARSLEEAVKKAYEGVNLIKFDGMQYRKDIAHRAFKRQKVGAGAEPLTYAQSGVSIEGGNQFVEQIKRAVASTKQPGAEAEIGGFGGEVDLALAGYPGAPVIVGAIDGVGTKLKIAHAMGRHDTVGIDLVAMNVNDLIVQGAAPKMFLDYIGCSKLDPAAAAAFVQGVAQGCIDAGCALVGGETAEMPGMYQPGEYDVAGAAIGVMRPSQRLPRKGDMLEGDVLLGLASNGLHSNGFSLVRRIVTERGGLKYSDSAPWNADGAAAAAAAAPASSVGDSLLTPTRIYVKSLLSVLESHGTAIKGLAHITGGGLTENVPRMLPSQLAAEIDVGRWDRPPVFAWLKRTGNVTPAEMGRTFNNGIGMVVAVAEGGADAVKTALQAQGETVFRIGRLTKRAQEPCMLLNLSRWD